MAAATMATAAGAMVVLFYVVSRRITSVEESDCIDEYSQSRSRSVKKRLSRRPAQAPATWMETIFTLTETLRFTYSETLGKWPIGDLAFGIKYLIRRQGDLQVASIYAGEKSVQLKGPDIIDQLYYYLRLLSLCMFFSKKPFPVFLEFAGFSEAEVLLQKSKAGLLQPAFTILRDEKSKCFLLLIRGTHSIKDTLTAALGAGVPFHHSVLHDGGIINLVLGYAHCGMVAAARWIAKLSTPTLLKALEQNPDYELKIIGHSLGGGTAAILTYILREQKELSASTCVTFAPAACMTWELAESGKQFITTIVNGSDLVPTFSTASVDGLRSEDFRSEPQSTWNKRPLGPEGGKSRNICKQQSSKGDDPHNKIRALKVVASSIEEITEGEWYELERELHRQENDVNTRVLEEANAMKVITEEEKKLADTVENQTEIPLSNISDDHHFYPPGRIMHIVSTHSSLDDQEEEQVAIYETSRELYNKLRLSRTMINDHYMPMYKKMMELLIRQLENELDYSFLVT